MMPGYDIQTPLDLLNEGKSEEAIPRLEFLVEHMPSHVTAHVLLAHAYSDEKRWREALSAWQNALFLMPNSPAIRKGLRQVLRILSRQPAPPVPQKAAPLEAEPVAPAASPAAIDQEADQERPAEETPAAVPIEDRAPDELTVVPVDMPPVRSTPAKRPTVMPMVPPVLASFVQSEAGIGEDEELDHLIQELEAARIVPKPEHEVTDMAIEDADIGDMASETLARIYEGQKKYDEAAEVYEKLAAMHPERAGNFNDKASELRSRVANEGD